MSISAENTIEGITMRMTCYHDCDNVYLCWRVSEGGHGDIPVTGCLGFKIERQRKDEGGQWGPVEVLRNRVGFGPNPPSGQHGDYRTEPSSVWSFQRYDWTDHGANSGETVRYRVSAMKLPAAGGMPGNVTLDEMADTGWSSEIVVNAEAGDGVSAFFNRGAVMSQYVARIARKNNWTAVDIKNHIIDLEEPLRRFLSGELRLAILRLLDEAIENIDLELYAALYELSDKELIDRLCLLHRRAHVVLSNGSDKQGDGNADARISLVKANVDVHDRLLGSKGLGHNKFAVLATVQKRSPIQAWTGSTNWAATGLCTQLNNGMLFKNTTVAGLFLEQWDRLEAASNDFPAALVADNAKSPRTVGNLDVWFTRVRNKSVNNLGLGSDIQALIDLVNAAQECILYVMFQPGSEPLRTILTRASSLTVRGVVSTVTPQLKEAFTLKGVGPGTKTYETALKQPEGVAKSFSAWVEEVTRYQFLSMPNKPGIGHAITHSKMIVIDPFTEGCKVITGSHNFSVAASEQNDENFVIVGGNRELAEAYAVACMATYAHYRWRAYVKEKADAGDPIWDHLDSTPAWQSQRLSSDYKGHLRLWCR